MIPVKLTHKELITKIDKQTTNSSLALISEFKLNDNVSESI